MARVVVVGLGPGDPALVTAGTLAAIEAAAPDARYLRTAVHPSAHLVAGAATFDHHYETADTFEEVYRAIVDDLVAAAERRGEVLYAVPGSPRVLERTVDLLVERAAAGEVAVDVLPALSFVDLAWVRLGVDPFADGVRLVDGHRFDVESTPMPAGPLLVAHCHNRRVLSDLKLAVDEPPAQPVVIVQRLGLPDEALTTVAWEDLDRSVEPDHLTSVYVPSLAPPTDEVAAFRDVVATLRVECPWDAEQTHATLTRHLLEEAHEVLEALGPVGDGGPDTDPAAYAHLEEELGDLLFQIVFHATLADEAGAFDLDDVARGIRQKLVGRHPHVFGDVQVAGADDVVANWEQIKKAEKGRSSVFEGIPATLPALLYALKVLKKAAALGVAPAVGDPSLGDRLLDLVAEARAADVDPELALRAAADALADRARAVEAELPSAAPEPGA